MSDPEIFAVTAESARRIPEAGHKDLAKCTCRRLHRLTQSSFEPIPLDFSDIIHCTGAAGYVKSYSRFESFQ